MSRPHTRHMWTMPEIKKLEELRKLRDPRCTRREMAEKLGVTPMAIRSKLQEIMKKERGAARMYAEAPKIEI